MTIGSAELKQIPDKTCEFEQSLQIICSEKRKFQSAFWNFFGKNGLKLVLFSLNQ